jgi:hypothetical protein
VQGSVAVGQAAVGATTIAVQGEQPTAAAAQEPQLTQARTSAGGGPDGPVAPQPGRKRPPIAALIAGGIAVVAAIGVGVAVLSSSSSSPGGGDPTPKIEATATNFIGASGAATCDLYTPAYIARNYTNGIADCRKSLSGAASTSVSGPQTVAVTGPRATDAFKAADGHHYSLVLVNQNGKWVVDDFADDTQDAQTAADDYIKAKGAAVCGLITPALRNASFGGASCPTTEASYTPATPAVDQVTATSTRATDKLSVNSNPGTLSLVKTGGTWLVDHDTLIK